ncbi:ABC transporter permease [Pseudoruegeria sp. SHC-113]|uniref:ABC transporter permease n=1 Tax=Pseudoruegeria sp. SHC-113 TaxID=2855439 RepID=UPI0021BB4862|nr:ABC transporter permease [Pseudoruegeria sp. SHC-113]MCT8162169.1 ABC transporter permease [Pseudoruegeria sp. SHC-113]
MQTYILRRLFQSCFVAAAVLILVFFVGHVIGDPVELMLPAEASDELIAEMRAKFGFDQPLSVQFVAFLQRVATGFGDSLWQKAPALEIALQRIVPTLYLTMTVLALSLPLALLLGTLAAFNAGTWIDRAITVFTLGGISTVDFWLGLLLIIVFSLTLGWFPTSGYGSFSHVVLPALALSYRSVGRMAQITRSAMLDEYAKPYIHVARANGLPETTVFVHALKNASIPILTIAGDEMAMLMGGAIAVETVFAWPGIGRLLVQAIYHRDLFLIEAVVTVIVVVIILVNLLIDLAYAWLDPKLRYE